MTVEQAPDKRRSSGVASRFNLTYLETMYELWQRDPESVEPSLRYFFEGFDLARCDRNCVSVERATDQSKVASLIYAYRDQGHKVARLDPLNPAPRSHDQLALSQFGLAEADLPRVFDTGHLKGPKRATLQEIIEILRETYCGPIGVEYLHIQDVQKRRWLQRMMEPGRNRPSFSREKRLEILRNLNMAELFETFIGLNYLGQKRFSLEGAETLIPALHSLVELAGVLEVEELVIGMAHRGRLNVLANILDKSYAMIFGEFEENALPDQVGGSGDVKYHKGFSSTHVCANGRSVHLSLTANPSHLEAVDPVVEGRARAKQRRRNDTERRKKVVPLLIHGDAAFAGQGLVAETLNLSSLEGYRTGGTVHFVVNNQIGFTTSPKDARSTPYATDMAKMIEAPIFHVNGDDPEATVFVTELALRYRHEFGADVVVDMVCYRRHGHNEGDEPAFTQPALYETIRSHPTVHRIYKDKLLAEGVLTPEMEQRIAALFKDTLEQALRSVRGGAAAIGASSLVGGSEHPEVEDEVLKLWQALDEPYSEAPVDTGVSHDVLLEVARALCTVPQGFDLNPKVARSLPKRLEAVTSRAAASVDWAFAEALSVGSLLVEGIPVRLSGQDSARGTFSQRHAVWRDRLSQQSYTPANHIRAGQAHFCVYNSMLSEAAVLGFDYGYSLVEPHMLILWEAQFGDFANGAQVIIDQFIVGAYAKWQRASGLVLLLPHGYEGQGPDHSNAYLERHLMACAEDNIQVCNLTTPAQYFHLLRRQVHRPFRRPLVIMAPKSMLRHPRAVSDVGALCAGGFQEILDDEHAPPDPERLIFCSGKVYWDLVDGRQAAEGRCPRVAIVRVEQFYPLGAERLQALAKRYPTAREVRWVQEEPQNRGGYQFMRGRLESVFGPRSITYVGRPPSASSATGSLQRHREEQRALVLKALS